MSKIRIAIDANAGKKLVDELSKKYEVVCVAGSGEKDHEWLNRAFALGAKYVISNDKDIPYLLETEGYVKMRWVLLPIQNPEWKGRYAQFVERSIELKEDKPVDKPSTNGIKFILRY